MRNYLTKNTFFDSAFDSLFDQVYKVNKVSMRTDIIESIFRIRIYTSKSIRSSETRRPWGFVYTSI
jgi:hypothetical protein